jgi:hypothetical protein
MSVLLNKITYEPALCMTGTILVQVALVFITYRMYDVVKKNLASKMYISAPVPTGNTFQNLPRLRETADNTERYI